MKPRIFIFLVIIFTSQVHAQWEWQNPLPSGARMDAVIVLSEEKTIVVGRGGTIMTSHDGGDSWKHQILSGVDWVRKYCAISEDECWLIGNYFDITKFNNPEKLNANKILKTNDGGITWCGLHIPTELETRDFDEIEFVSSNQGYLISEGEIFSSNDGGESWDLTDFGMSDSYRMIKGLDETNLFLITQPVYHKTHSYGNLHRSTDGGLSWSSYQESDFAEIYFINDQLMWSGNYRSTDGGFTWEYVDFTYPNSLTVFTKHRFINDSVGYGFFSSSLYKTIDGGGSWELIHSAINDFGFSNLSNGIVCGKGGVIETTSDGGINWIRHGEGKIEGLYDLEFIDENYGWVVGANSTVLSTSNGGNTWTQRNIPEECYPLLINGIDFIDKVKGWVVGGNYILHSTNGGVDWNIQAELSLEGGSFQDVLFLNEQVGFAVGRFGTMLDGVIFRSDDGGLTWTRQEDGRKPYLTSICFIDDENGWISGGGYLMSTTDSGITWNEEFFSEHLGYVQFVDNEHGWITAQSEGAFYKTTNGGENWINIPYENRALQGFESFCFLNEEHGIATSIGGRLFSTIDGGNNWNYSKTLAPVRFERIMFLNDSTGWAIGDGGSIIKFDQNYFNITTISEHPPATEDNFVGSVYPNPFNGHVNIQINLERPIEVEISIYNILGQLLDVIIPMQTHTGNNTIKWEPVDLNSGVYLIKISDGNNSNIIKTIYMK